MNDGEATEITYSCAAGHGIEASRLDLQTEIVVLDRGARVRQCREHGTAVILSRGTHRTHTSAADDAEVSP